MPGVYRNDKIAYQLTFFRDSTFENGTKGYPGYCEWGCHIETGKYRLAGDSIYMYLESVDGMEAVNNDYGRGIMRGDSLDIFFYEPKNGPYSYGFYDYLPLPLGPAQESPSYLPILR